MFDEEMITWSVDGGGNLFYRPRHKFSVTNVSGYLKLDTSVLDYRFAHASLALQHSKLTFDYQTKAHPSVIRKLYHLPLPPLPEQKKIAEILSGIDNYIRLTTIQISKTEELERGLLEEVFLAPDLSPSDGDALTVSELESDGLITLGRGNIISKQDIQRLPGGFPIYSSSGKGDGKFGEYGEHMFDEELITWSIDGGGRLFHRKRHKFSVTNVCGYLRINEPHLDYRYAHLALVFQHGRLRFDYSFKAHPSVIREIYRLPVPPLERQKEVADIFDGIQRTRLALMEKNMQLTNMKSAVASDLLSGRKRVSV